MSAGVRNALIGIGIILVLSFLLGMIGEHGLSTILVPVIFGGGTWFVLSNLQNNRKVDNAPDAERDALLNTPPAPGTALLYVYREGFMGTALGVDVVLDGVPVAQLKSPRFVRLVVAPGEHMLAAGPKGFAGAQNKAGATPLSIADGEAVMISLSIKMGLMQNDVTLMREMDVRAALGRLHTNTMVRPAS